MQWITFATCLTQKNTTLDFGMPHWHFMQHVATRGSATRQENVIRDHNFTIYFTKIIVIINQHIKIHSTAC